jgi:hypothetical protein
MQDHGKDSEKDSEKDVTIVVHFPSVLAFFLPV